MSGGSYNYLYSTAPEELQWISSSIKHMAEKCLERVDGPDAVCWDGEKDAPLDRDALRRCGEHLAKVAAYVDASARLISSLTETLRAVEWWASGDQTEGGVVDVFSKEVVAEHVLYEPSVRVKQLEDAMVRMHKALRLLIVSGGPRT